jgi:DNA polymerase elongation subunit (family B)
METRVKTLERIYYTEDKFINKYPNSNTLKVLVFDIETDTFMTFPDPDDNCIISIGCQLNNEPIKIFSAETFNDDSKIINDFFAYIKEVDPDIFCGYNSTFFDFPFFARRCEINSISTSGFSRDDREIFITAKQVYISGRSSYDIFSRSTLRDQSLFTKAPKNKRLKTIATLYGLKDVIVEDANTMSNMRALVGTQRLHDYLESDIRATKFLCDIYLPGILSLAETINVSIDSCIVSTPAFVPSTIFSRKFHELGVISDMNVMQAHPNLIDRQGAYVACYQPGIYFSDIKKVDMRSYYPNLLRMLNLSSETAKIIRVENKLKPYNAEMDSNNILTLSVPDEKLNKQIIIEIDFNTRGFASEFIDTMMEERAEMKSEMHSNEHGSTEWNGLNTRQINHKVIANSLTGFFSQGYANFGSLASYIAITGTARYIIMKLIDHVESTIALDTDGIIINSGEKVEDLNEWLEDFVLTTFKVPKNYLVLEEEPIEAAFFRDAKKQYLVLEDGRLLVHGISFKGSNLPKLFSSIIEDIGLRMLQADHDLDTHIDKYYDVSQFTLDNIKKSVKVKPPGSYSAGNAIGKQLGLQYEARFKTKITHETSLSYVKIKSKRGSNYQLITIFDSMKDVIGLDLDYYIQIVNNAIDRLGLVRPDMRAQTSMFDF